MLQREKQEHRLFGLDDDYYLPISHRADDPLDTAGMEVATLDTALGANNKGLPDAAAHGLGRQGPGPQRGRYVAALFTGALACKRCPCCLALLRQQCSQYRRHSPALRLRVLFGNAGIAEPIKGGVEAGLRLGVGKAEEDSYYTAAENIVRKRLEVEVQAEEDEDRTRRREVRQMRKLCTSACICRQARALACLGCMSGSTAMAADAMHLAGCHACHKAVPKRREQPIPRRIARMCAVRDEGMELSWYCVPGVLAFLGQSIIGVWCGVGAAA